jgi:hypothetical protein
VALRSTDTSTWPQATAESANAKLVNDIRDKYVAKYKEIRAQVAALDVDSKLSPEIVRQIWRAKSHRQLIFASHNANFVVNGDAELVVCCDYVKAGDQTGGQIKAVGAIDNVAIRDEITAVTEGGKEAFILRMEKYGF